MTRKVAPKCGMSLQSFIVMPGSHLSMCPSNVMVGAIPCDTRWTPSPYRPQHAARVIVINLEQNIRPMSPRGTDAPILREERNIVGLLTPKDDTMRWVGDFSQNIGKATDVIPHKIWSRAYVLTSRSARISNRRQVASSEPVPKA